jgi:hypothetical protein
MEYIIGPVIGAVLGVNISILASRKVKADVKAVVNDCIEKVEFIEEQLVELNTKVQTVENTVDVIDKQTLQKMVTTLQPVATSIRDIQSFVGMK